MRSVGAYEAKTHLSALLEQVSQGEHITITRHGVPLAMLVPVPGHESFGAGDVFKDLRAFRKGRGLGGVSIRELIEEGRRF